MATPFTVEVLTPEGEAFKDEVELLSTRTTNGSIGVLANHQPLLAMLDPAELRLHRPGGAIDRFAAGEGYLQMAKLHALVLVDELVAVDQLDGAALAEKVREAQGDLERAQPDSEEARQAQRALRRHEAFAKIAAGGDGIA